MASVFYGRTVSRTGDKRRRGVILGCERNWRKWMDGDPAFFGRAGFRGWGARADIVLTRGVVLAVEGFDLRPARSGTHLFMGRTYDGARQKVLGMSLTAYF